MIVYNSEIYHYGMPRRSGRYKWGSGKNPFHHGADVVKAKDAYKKKRNELRLQRLALVGNRAIHPVAGVKSELGFNAHTKIGRRFEEQVEKSDQKTNKLRLEKENLKIKYKKEKIKEKYGNLSVEELNKKLSGVEVNPSKIQNKVAEVRKNRDAKLAASNTQKIKDAKNAPNATKASIKKEEFRAARRVVRRDRNRAIGDMFAHPISGYYRYGISNVTQRGKRVGRTVQQNKERMYEDRRKKLAAKNAYKKAKRNS